MSRTVPNLSTSALELCSAQKPSARQKSPLCEMTEAQKAAIRFTSVGPLAVQHAVPCSTARTSCSPCQLFCSFTQQALLTSSRKYVPWILGTFFYTGHCRLWSSHSGLRPYSPKFARASWKRVSFATCPTSHGVSGSLSETLASGGGLFKNMQS